MLLRAKILRFCIVFVYTFNVFTWFILATSNVDVGSITLNPILPDEPCIKVVLSDKNNLPDIIKFPDTSKLFLIVVNPPISTELRRKVSLFTVMVPSTTKSLKKDSFTTMVSVTIELALI